jgi:hypothetical protein
MGMNVIPKSKIVGAYERIRNANLKLSESEVIAKTAEEVGTDTDTVKGVLAHVYADSDGGCQD